MKNKWDELCKISPSLICLDMLQLGEQIKKIQACGIDMLHIDILDGCFSPSMPLGFETVKQLRKITDMAFECHVMANSPEYYIRELLEIGVEQIVFQLEPVVHIDGLINLIHSYGTRAGLALAPSTPLSVLEYEIEKSDAVLLMRINPGFASNNNEEKVCYAGKKVKDLYNFIEEKNLNTKIIIDGRVSVEDMKQYGNIVNIFVAGSTCVDRNNLENSVNNLMNIRKNIIG
ncbi:MAG: ribulose-phosphate 3-epimerase [Selenomonadaceae bacterium]|nr:ribulose-phosphate 3-epimerase [Selenomonadaceae bacterium]